VLRAVGLLIPLTSLRGQTVRSAIEVRDLAHVVASKHDHEKPCKTYSHTTVRGAPVPEEGEIVLKWCQVGDLFKGLSTQHVDTMLALRTGRDFQPLPQQVEAVGQADIVRVPHMVERPHVDRVVRHEHEFVPERFLDVRCESPLTLRVQIFFVGDWYKRWL